MKTVRINLYEFGELNKAAKDRALNDLYDINVDYSWWDPIYADANVVGIEIESFDLYGRGPRIQGQYLWDPEFTRLQILADHGEKTGTYKIARNTNLNDEERLEQLLDEYWRTLRDEYDYLMSKKAIVSTIDANEYMFLQDGMLATMIEKQGEPI